MKNRKKNVVAAGFALLAVLLVAVAVMIAVRCRNTPARVIVVPREAGETAVALMDAVCSGDFEGAERYLQGEPNLGVDRRPADPAAAAIWDAFADSLSYKLDGECYISNDSVCQDVEIRAMKIASVTENLNLRTQTLLNQWVESAEDTSIFYDENDAYLDSVVQEALLEAVTQAIQEDARYTQQNITLKLTYSNGQWWVMPESDLLRAISDGIAG